MLVADPAADAANVSFQVAEGGIDPFESRDLAVSPTTRTLLGVMTQPGGLGDAVGGPFVSQQGRGRADGLLRPSAHRGAAEVVDGLGLQESRPAVSGDIRN